MRTVMVVDDEKDIRQSLEGVLGDDGFSVILASDGEESLSKLDSGMVDLILLDIWMPGIDGLDVLGRIKKIDPTIPVIMISGHATIETAVKATRLGAYDFIEKPLSLDKIVLTINHALDQKRLSEENESLRKRLARDYRFIGKNRSIEILMSQVAKVAPTASWVLITGENGTGKELVARNIHLLSERREEPFIEVNCAALPDELIESELFGYEKGAFTGALSSKKGKFDLADRGTIFLDEIGDMSLKTQAKVLRILQEQRFERIGGTTTIEVDARVIAATNKNLEDEIRKGNFRVDLYYRLNVIPFHIIPLRERKDDIPLFIDYYLDMFASETGRGRKNLTEEALSAFMQYDWPGNVRELKNLIERLVIMCSGNMIKYEDLPPNLSKTSDLPVVAAFAKSSLKDARDEFEREFILRKMGEFGGNVARTAEAIGVERSNLYRKLRSYGLKKE